MLDHPTYGYAFWSLIGGFVLQPGEQHPIGRDGKAAHLLIGRGGIIVGAARHVGVHLRTALRGGGIKMNVIQIEA